MGYWLLMAASAALIGWILYQKRLTNPAPRHARPPTSEGTDRATPPSERPPPNRPAPEPEPVEAPAEVEETPVPERPEPRPAPPPDAFVPPAPARVTGFPRPVNDVLEAQVCLSALGISCGPIDGISGSQTSAALRAFQRQAGLRQSGLLTAATRARLILRDQPMKTYVVTSNDLARLLPVSSSWLGKSRQPRLDYETALELVAERHRASTRFIQRRNPGVNWANPRPGLAIRVPRAMGRTNVTKAAYVRIQLGARTLQAFDYATNLLAHFPCSIARRVEKRPVGELQVEVVIPNPDYTFNPAIFTDSAEARELGRKLMIPPGPNNPVGVAWIGLSLRGYGIHGTPAPELVGRTESHGCFRLANWDAEYLSRLVQRGTPVFVDP